MLIAVIIDHGSSVQSAQAWSTAAAITVVVNLNFI